MSNNINANANAVISEKQLWAHFVAHPVNVSLGAGTVIERYKPDDIVRDPGVWGCMSDFARDLAEGLLQVDDTEDELCRRIGETEAYIAGLRSVLEDFRRVKTACEVAHDGDDEVYRLPSEVAVTEVA